MQVVGVRGWLPMRWTVNQVAKGSAPRLTRRNEGHLYIHTFKKKKKKINIVFEVDSSES